MRTHAKAASAGSTEGRSRSARLARRLGLTVLLAGLLTGLLATGPAAAAPTAGSAYVYSHSFATQGQLFGGTGLGVERGTSNLVVPAGAYASVFSPGSTPTDPMLTYFAFPESPHAIAIDQDSGAIYLELPNTLTRWTSDGAAVPSYTLDPSLAPEGGDYGGVFAVDPMTGDLLIVEPSAREVTRLDSSGARLSSFPLPLDFPNGVTAVAVDSDGEIYIAEETFGNGPNRVRRFTAAGESLGFLSVAGSAQGLILDPATGGVDVAAARAGGVWLEGFDSTGERVFEAPFPGSLQGATVHGIAVDDESGRLYALTGFPGADGIHVFEAVLSPGSEAPTVSAVTDTTAHLKTEVDPGAGPPAGSFAYFEYSNDGGSNWKATPSQDIAAAGSVEADLSGLRPNDKYLVRAIVGNELTRYATNPTSFTTVAVTPITVTGSATDVSETTAVINGTINPAGLQATYHFEYGLSAAYGNRTPVSIEAVAGNGRAPRIFSRTLTGLQPGVTYHYRLVTKNSLGTSAGEDRTFTASTPGASPARAYEQVTPVDKLGSSIDPTVGFQSAPDGSAISYLTRSPRGAESSPQFSRFMSYRGSSDWQSGIHADPPMNTARSTVFTLTLGISNDFSHAFVVSNRDLISGGIENGANLYREDLRSGQYTLVASSEGTFAFGSFSTLAAQNKFLWGNSDYSEVVFLSPAPLLPGVGSTALYRWSVADGLQLESILPDGSLPNAEVVQPSVAGDSRYVSEGGRRAYFTLRWGNENGIFLREDGQTRAISVSRRAGDPATPQEGIFLAASKDGRYGFFYTESAQLTDDAPEVQGDIYRYDAVTDELEYIGAKASAGQGPPSNNAALGISDDGDTFYFAGRDGIEVWRNGTVHLIGGTGVTLGSGFVSPSGRYLGYAEEATGGVFLYEAASEELTCASCLSDGSNPGGANLPFAERFGSNRIPSAVSDQGQLFFDTTARLVAADSNGASDVYEYRDGKARLISPGNAPFAARFGDISENGRDVFFTTAQKLVGRDGDLSTDIYDARVNGGLPAQSPPPPQECLRDDCKATPGAGPELPFGGSEALSGPGNVNAQTRKRCAKGTHARKVKGKQRCVKQKQAKKKSKQVKKAKSNRRQAR